MCVCVCVCVCVGGVMLFEGLRVLGFVFVLLVVVFFYCFFCRGRCGLFCFCLFSVLVFFAVY